VTTPARRCEATRRALDHDERMPSACPCGLPQPYEACCGRFHRANRTGSGALPATAEQLMRSRYSAFAVGDEIYLVDSWHPSTRPRSIRPDPGQEWVGLEVLRVERGGLFDDEGTVAFRATSRVGSRQVVVVEDSRFAREDGRWYYVGRSDA
jgi:SEC-C motif-containing protein